MFYRNLQIKIELTKKCFLACKHCSSKSGSEEFVEIPSFYIDRIIEASHILKRIVLTGGEPLLCSHFSETLNKFNKAGFLPCVYTSGNIGNIDAGSQLGYIAKRVSKIIVSLHGPEHIHDQITKVSGSFAIALEFVEEARKHGIPVSIHIVVLKENILSLLSFINWLKRRDIRDISILRYVPQGRGREQGIISPSKNVLENIIKALISQNVRVGAPFNFLREDKIVCKAGFMTASVDVFGNVIPCDAFKFCSNHYIKNNLKNNNLIEIIRDSNIFKYARANSRMHCDKECCLAQYIIQQREEEIAWVQNDSYA